MNVDIKQLQDNIDVVTTENVFGCMFDYYAPGGIMLKPYTRLPINGSATLTMGNNSITLTRGSSFTIEAYGKVRRVVVTRNTSFNVAGRLDTNPDRNNVDPSLLQHGKDYYIYAYVSGDGANDIDIIVSLNSSYPDDGTETSPYTEENTRKIGGFHYGTVRCVNVNGNPITANGETFTLANGAWRSNVIPSMVIPNSIWDLYDTDGGRIPHRDGTVMIGGSWNADGDPEPVTAGGYYSKKGGMFWCDIYQNSYRGTWENINTNFYVAGTIRSVSEYGRMPTVPSGIKTFDFVPEMYQKQNTFLLTYAEWRYMSYGSPAGENNNIYAYTATSNTAPTYTGCFVNAANGTFNRTGGLKAYAVSAWNCVDCTGNLTEIIDLTGTQRQNYQQAYLDVVATSAEPVQARAWVTNGATNCGVKLYFDRTYHGLRCSLLDSNGSDLSANRVGIVSLIVDANNGTNWINKKSLAYLGDKDYFFTENSGTYEYKMLTVQTMGGYYNNNTHAGPGCYIEFKEETSIAQLTLRCKTKAR